MELLETNEYIEESKFIWKLFLTQEEKRRIQIKKKQKQRRHYKKRGQRGGRRQ